jgi:hypothetical protein
MGLPRGEGCEDGLAEWLAIVQALVVEIVEQDRHSC